MYTQRPFLFCPASQEGGRPWINSMTTLLLAALFIIQILWYELQADITVAWLSSLPTASFNYLQLSPRVWCVYQILNPPIVTTHCVQWTNLGCTETSPCLSISKALLSLTAWSKRAGNVGSQNRSLNLDSVIAHTQGSTVGLLVIC